MLGWLKQCLHILGQRSGNVKRESGAGMDELEATGVEGLTGNQCEGAAVEVVAEQGMTEMGEVDADLMRAAGIQTDAEQGELLGCPR